MDTKLWQWKFSAVWKTNDETRMTWDLKFNVNASKLQLLSSIGVGASWNLLLLVALKPKQSVTTYKSPGGRVELPSGILLSISIIVFVFRKKEAIIRILCNVHSTLINWEKFQYTMKQINYLNDLTKTYSIMDMIFLFQIFNMQYDFPGFFSCLRYIPT